MEDQSVRALGRGCTWLVVDHDVEVASICGYRWFPNRAKVSLDANALLAAWNGKIKGR